MRTTEPPLPPLSLDRRRALSRAQRYAPFCGVEDCNHIGFYCYVSSECSRFASGALYFANGLFGGKFVRYIIERHRPAICCT